MTELGECIQWSPVLLFVFTVANIVMWWSFEWIAVNILRSTWGPLKPEIRGVYWLFACLFGAAGWNSFVNALLLWWPLYTLKAFTLIAVATIATATAIVYKPMSDYMARLRRHVAYLESELAKVKDGRDKA